MDRRPGRAEPTGATPLRQNCILGLLLEGHLGDALCTTPLARQLVQEKGMTVNVTEHPNTRAAFANNPFVSGYSMAKGFSPLAWREGDGHVIQQLQRGLGLEVSEPPRPEVYLSPQERAWASTWLAQNVPAGRKVCVLSAQVVSTADQYGDVDWDRVSLTLQEEYAVVQPLLSTSPVDASRGPEAGHEQPRHEGQTPGAVVV
ncbi:MAG: hypothetical protein HY906_13910, partial [Deltaproteobacteria bacterium]|nr:hypothetical protein [Deltaproteobacteria bacterium]